MLARGAQLTGMHLFIRVVFLQVHADVLGVRLDLGDDAHAGEDQQRQKQPGHAQRVLVECLAGNVGHFHHDRAQDQAEEGAEGDKAERLGAQAGRHHVGRRHPQLLGGIHAHAEDKQADGEQHDALQRHGGVKRQGAGQRQAKTKEHARLAPEDIGDLADRIGDQEPAHADESDRKAGKRRRSGQGNDHERAESIGELHARAGKGQRKGEQRDIALDESGNGDGHDLATNPPVFRRHRSVKKDASDSREGATPHGMPWLSSLVKPSGISRCETSLQSGTARVQLLRAEAAGPPLAAALPEIG